MEKVTRKSTKRLKLNIKFEKNNNLYCLIFTLEKPFYSIIIGSTDFTSFEKPKDMISKIPAIFYNSIRDYVYIVEDELENELNKLKTQYVLDLKNKKVK